MPPKRRRVSPLPLVGLSLVLILLPSRYAETARLTALAGFGPFRSLGNTAAGLASSGLSPAEAQELQTRLEYLQDELTRTMNRNAVLQAQLRQATGMKQAVHERGYGILFADVVIPTDSSAWRASITLALGSRGGVREGMVAAYNNQLVGRVSEVGPWTSRVQLVTDPAFRARAVSVPKVYDEGVSFDRRHVGMYMGSGGGGGRLAWITSDTPVEKGARVMTTEDPVGGVPKGLVIGRVAHLQNERSAEPVVAVEPFLNFGALEHVMLLSPPAEAR